MFAHGRKRREREREEENFAFIDGSSLGTINCELSSLGKFDYYLTWLETMNVIF
jgi:hypothetical protein